MRPPPTCPRCGAGLRAPGLWSTDWSCSAHGAVVPVQGPLALGEGVLDRVARTSGAPVWLPWPLPTGWLLTGVQVAGDERSGPAAVAVACSGPHPVGCGRERSADLVVVAEPPGTGLGARFAGLDAVDPGDGVLAGAPHARVCAAGHPAPLWHVPTEGRAAYVGEAAGVWLWLVLWPATAGALLLEELELVDARERARLDVPVGAPSPRLR